LRTGGTVAVKLIHPVLAHNRTYRERLRREAQIAAAITSPRVVRVVDLAEYDGTPFLVMEYVSGETLHARLRRGGPLPPGEALAVALEVAWALQAADSAGVVHRDLKPENVMLVDGQVKVLDFGVARADGISSLTVTGSFVGTPEYSAPERADGLGDIRSDIYSLGALLFAALEGRPPFAGPTPFAVLRHHRETPPPVPASLPWSVQQILRRCLAKAPEDRYQTPRELVHAIEAAVLELGGSAPSIGRGPGTVGGAPMTPLPNTYFANTSETPSDPGQLPVSLTSFVGREAETEAVRRLLARTRLLTLTGAGGIGKTRLAVHVAALERSGFTHGVRLVDLSAVADGAALPRAVAAAVGVRESPGKAWIDAVVETLRSRRLLLVLDNCERVVEACATFAETVLRHCPGLRLLVTSRTALGVSGELTWSVPPLGLPNAIPSPVEAVEAAAPSIEQIAECAAVRLFVDRATAVNPRFALTERNAATVAEICARLDGLPLAIELAAARVKVLSVEQIAARLGDRFRLLTGGSRTALPHHQTLRAAMEWSYALLEPSEQALFRRLGVFAGGCTMDAVEGVLSTASSAEATNSVPATQYSSLSVLDGLTALVDKSLLVNRPAGSESRFEMLQTVRDFARERLGEAGEADAAGCSHFEYFEGLAREADGHLRGEEQLTWLSRVEREHDNLRAALDWCVAGGDADAAARGLGMAAALGWFWYLRGHRQEGRNRLERSLASAPAAPPSIRARALAEAGHLALWAGDPAGARRRTEEACALARETGEPLALAWALLYRSVVAAPEPEPAQAEARWCECLALFRAQGVEWGAALSLSWLGQLAYERDDVAAAAGQFQESLDHFRRVGDRWGTAHALARLATVAERQGDLAQAEAHLREQQELARLLGHRGAMAGGLSRLGAIALQRGDLDRARTSFAESLALYRAIGERQTTTGPLEQLALIALRSDQDPAGAAALLREAFALWQEYDDEPGLVRGLLACAELAWRRGETEAAARLLASVDAALVTVACESSAATAGLAAAAASLRSAIFSSDAAASPPAAAAERSPLPLPEAVALALAGPLAPAS
jgi:non-specific serine/threonine protein kinase